MDRLRQGRKAAQRAAGEHATFHRMQTLVTAITMARPHHSPPWWSLRAIDGSVLAPSKTG